MVSSVLGKQFSNIHANLGFPLSSRFTSSIFWSMTSDRNSLSSTFGRLDYCAKTDCDHSPTHKATNKLLILFISDSFLAYYGLSFFFVPKSDGCDPM